MSGASDVRDTREAGDADDLTCENVEAKWREFVDENNQCETDEDCRIVSDVETCNCTPSLTGSGVGLNVDATGAGRFLDKFHSDECVEDAPQVCDAAPADEVRCSDGECRADAPSCFDGDAG